MDLKNLKDGELLANTERAAADERSATTRLLHHLIEIERRRLFAKVGCSSLFEYCVRVLLMSEPQAARRVNAARLLRDLPILESKLESGTLTLTAASQAQSFFRQEKMAKNSVSVVQKLEILHQLEKQSTRNVDKILQSHSAMQNEKCAKISLDLDDETAADLERLKEIWSHELPHGDPAQIIKKALAICREKYDPVLRAEKQSRKTHVSEPVHKIDDESATNNRPTPAPESESKLPDKRSRYIPAPIRRKVWLRDGGRCTYHDEATGRDCHSRHRLQLDHILPFAMGGENIPENLRLRCLAHNQWHALQSYGPSVLKYAKR